MKFLLWPGLMCPRVAPNSLCTLPWLWTPEHPSSTSQVLANMSLFMWPWGWGQDLVNAGQAPYQNSLELLMFFFKPGSHYASMTGLKPSIAQATFRNLTLLWLPTFGAVGVYHRPWMNQDYFEVLEGVWQKSGQLSTQTKLAFAWLWIPSVCVRTPYCPHGLTINLLHPFDSFYQPGPYMLLWPLAWCV